MDKEIKMEENFDDYMIFFKGLTIKEKQSIIHDQLKILTSFTNKLCKESGIENEVIINREILDLNKEDYTEDDFTEAVITYINSIQNSICDYSNKITDLLDNLSNSEM